MSHLLLLLLLYVLRSGMLDSEVDHLAARQLHTELKRRGD